MSKKRYGFKSDPDLPHWYSEIFYKLGFRRINGMGRNYYINLIDGIVCRVTRDGMLREMKDGATPKQYGRVKLKMKDGTFKKFYTHRLIADFIPNPENKPVVNHKLINRNENGINNLEWTTQKENLQDYYKHKKEEF